MITTIKTKDTVLIDPINMVYDIVYLSIENLVYNGTTYEVTLRYFIKKDWFDETINISASSFTVEELAMLEKALQIKATTIDDRLQELLPKALIYEVWKRGIYWLDAKWFEEYIETIEETLPVIE